MEARSASKDPRRSTWTRNSFRQLGRCFLSTHFDRPALFQISKPRVLSLGELPRVAFDEFNRLVERVLTFEVLDDFAVADRLQGRRAQSSEAIAKRASFCDEPFGEHSIDPLLDPAVEPLSRRTQPIDVSRSLGLRQRRMKLQLRHRPTADFDHLQRPHDPAEIVRVDFFRARRIERSQTLVQRLSAGDRCFAFQPLADC